VRAIGGSWGFAPSSTLGTSLDPNGAATTRRFSGFAGTRRARLASATRARKRW
jgi:hypothetical protein